MQVTDQSSLFLHIDIQLFQYHLLNRLSFFHWPNFALLKRSVIHIYVNLFLDSLILLCWSVCLPSCPYLREGNGNPLQYSCLENPIDRGAFSPWVAKSWTRLSDFTFTFHFHALEKEMATHSSILPWRISGTGEPGGLPSLGSQRVGHDWSDLAQQQHAHTSEKAMATHSSTLA